MALNAPTEGEMIGLARIINKTTPTDPILRLFTDNITPTDTANYADFTEPGAGFGYAASTCTGSVWTITLSGSVAYATYNTVTFTFSSGAVSVYGYMISDSTSKIVWIERFSGAPYTIPTDGGTIKVQPKVTLD